MRASSNIQRKRMWKYVEIVLVIYAFHLKRRSQLFFLLNKSRRRRTRREGGS